MTIRILVALAALVSLYLGYDLVQVQASLVEDPRVRDSLVDRGIFLHIIGIIGLVWSVSHVERKAV